MQPKKSLKVWRERQYFGHELRKLENVEWVMLPEICEINSESADPKSKFKNENFVYIDISGVESGTGRVSFKNQLSSDNAPSRARRVVQNDDVIMSTVRPNLKAIALLKNLPDRAIVSTGFAVLRAKSSLDPHYLYLTLGTHAVVSQMTARMGKGSYPSINENDVEQIKVPLPSLEVQKQLVAEAEKEKEIIVFNRKLIKLMENKIENVLSEI